MFRIIERLCSLEDQKRKAKELFAELQNQQSHILYDDAKKELLSVIFNIEQLNKLHSAWLSKTIRENQTNRSALLFLLGICPTEPVGHIEYSGGTLPDIDMDFCKIRRGEIIEHLKETYGHNRVAPISTFVKMKPKAAIRMIARTEGIAEDRVQKLLRHIPSPIAGKEADFERIFKESPKIKSEPDYWIVEKAVEAENLISAQSVHAAGIIVSDQDIDTIVPTYIQVKNPDNIISQFDMESCEANGLIKIDVLALKNLSIIEKALELIKKRTGKDIDLEKINLNDKKVYDEVLAPGYTDGIFQLDQEEGGMRQLLVELRPQNIDEIAVILALYRPGPLGDNIHKKYCARKAGLEQVNYPHKAFKKILDNTQGLFVYQEQIMQLATEMCGYTLVEADDLRKALGKKKEKLLNEVHKPRIVEGLSKYISKEEAEEMYTQVADFAKYSFNACLSSDTQILLADGSTKRVSEVNIGDILLSFSIKNQLILPDICEDKIITGEQDVYEITLEGGKKVECTLDHKFLCKDLKKHTLKEILEQELEIIIAL